MDSTELQPYLDRLSGLYAKMDQEYDRVATELDFSCNGCDDNCCDSLFIHHTYIEWIFLIRGIRQMAADVQARLVATSREYLGRMSMLKAKGEEPLAMCPLNQEGKCMAYGQRMMLCRLHGVPAKIIMPTGVEKRFGGCFFVQEKISGSNDFPEINRTPFLTELAVIERDLLTAAGPHPKVKLSIAEMIIKGEPEL